MCGDGFHVMEANLWNNVLSSGFAVAFVFLTVQCLVFFYHVMVVFAHSSVVWSWWGAIVGGAWLSRDHCIFGVVRFEEGWGFRLHGHLPVSLGSVLHCAPRHFSRLECCSAPVTYDV